MSKVCNENIFSDFFSKHAKALRNFIYYKYGDEDSAADITQESFIKLWQNCKEVPLEKAKSYLYTIANNLSLNVVKHKKVVLNFEKNSVQNETNFETPDFIIEENEFEKQLNDAINQLTEAQRIAFLMSRIDGKKYSEIAEELGISVKAVEKRIHQALLSIKQSIKNYKI